MVQSARAVSCNLGRRRESDGPVSSALANAIPPPSTLDNSIRPSMIIPIPPSH